MKLFDILVKKPNHGEPLAKSKNEARRLILNRGIKLNDFTVIDSNADVFLHENLWLLVESNRLTVINTVDGSIKSVDITPEEYQECIKKDL